MHTWSLGIWIMSAALAVGATGQTPATPSAAGAGAAPDSTRTVVRKKPRAKTVTQPAQVLSIPIETAPPSGRAPAAVAAQQKAADQKLLQQQQQQSAQAAQVTNQEVQQAQRQKDAIQNEVRIQDAPGPAQTGVIPAAVAPVVPGNSEQRIQDAPGPAQTLSPASQVPQTPVTNPHL